MGKKILAFGPSNRSRSIYKRLATYAANLLQGAESIVLDLNHFEFPVYSIDWKYPNTCSHCSEAMVNQTFILPRSITFLKMTGVQRKKQFEIAL
ncbi:MAG: hypothetical protein AAGH81_01535 [Bacteroidota bacterium]